MKPNPLVGQGTPLHQWQSSSRLAELPCVAAADLVPQGSRAVIIAPHPDDEVLGCTTLDRFWGQRSSSTRGKPACHTPARSSRVPGECGHSYSDQLFVHNKDPWALQRC